MTRNQNRKNRRQGSRILGVFLGLIAFLGVAYGALLVHKPLLTDDIREAEAPESSFVRLSAGVTEYTVAGPADGEPLVLVSGFSVPYFCWDPVIPGLTDAGFRVYRYNHFGRGFSDHVQGRYTPDLFDTQLREFLDAMELEGPVNLVGLSMGGAISVTFTNRRPERVKNLVLISPAGFPLEEALTARLVKIPIIGDYIFVLAGDAVLKGRNASNLSRYNEYPEFQQNFERQFAYRGFGRAILSTLRYMPFSNIPGEYSALGEKDVPVCLIWGRNDAVIPFEQSELVLAAVPRAEFFPLDTTGHVSVYENPDAVVPIVARFLGRGGRD